MTTAVRGEAPAPARPQLWRISDRATFRALQATGRRVRRGPLQLTWLPAPEGSDAPPRAAFTVGRSAGGAVVRNRIRRRLRAGLRTIHAAGGLPPGSYLVGGGSELAAMAWPELLGALEAAVGSATARSVEP